VVPSPDVAYSRPGSEVFFEHVKSDRIEMVRKFLERDKFMKFQQNPMGQTALHVAASRNLLAICKLLIIFGCDVNHKDIAGRTALYFAVKYNFREVVTTLVANFSSCFVIDKYSHSLDHVATAPLIKLIIEKGKIY
jgi:ankyrin repeat protein